MVTCRQVNFRAEGALDVTFQEYFQQVKDRFAGADVSGVASPTRIQIDITGEAAGTFYVEIKDGKLAVEPMSTTTGTCC